MFGKLLKAAGGLVKDGERMLNRALDQSVFKRIVYTGYLIAAADDNFDANEKTALVALIKKDFPDFDVADVIEMISICETKVAFDKTLGTQEIIDEISKSGDNIDEAKQIMNVCGFIGKADGKYDRSEQVMARRICQALKLDTSNYGI